MTTEIKQQAGKEKDVTDKTASNGAASSKPSVMAITDGNGVVATYTDKDGVESTVFGTVEVQRIGSGRVLSVKWPDGSLVRIVVL